MKLLNEDEKPREIANMAGNFHNVTVCSLSTKNEACVAVMSASSKNELNAFKSGINWIIDSGATCHMTSTLASLDNVDDSNKNVGRGVHLPNGQITLVTHSGSCGKLDNVLVVPDFKYDLLSVSQLTRQLQCSVCFFPEFCVFQDLFNGEVKGIGKEIEGLYYFSNQFHEKSASDDSKVLMTKAGDTGCMLWHNRMGHPSIKVLKQLSLVEKNFDVKVCDSCSVCPLAKQTRLPFPLSLSTTNDIFDLIHLDVWGPHRFATHEGFKFFLTVVDDKSRMTWLFLLKFKSDVFAVLKSFLALVGNQFNKQVKRIRSDNGTEFFNKDCNTLFSSLGIIHESSCPHTPQQNGVVERKHRHILEVARALRFQGSIPIRF